VKDEDVAQLVKSLKDNAERLGLIWTRRFGTVVAINPLSRTYAAVQMDSPVDTAVPIDCVSLCGQLTVGSRVVVDSVPPAGKFVCGVLTDARPGQKLVKILQATCSGAITLTTSEQDVPGATVTYSSLVTHTYCAWATFDISYTVTGVTTAVGLLVVDSGSAEPEQAILSNDGTIVVRATPGQTWSNALAAGSHTLKLRSRKTANGATVAVNTNTTLLVHVYEPL
jgi:hypothetical protein